MTDSSAEVKIGDCRDLIQAIPDASIDLILCDPVYQDIWQYKWVAEQAARVLKPDRSVVCQAGHIHRFEAECAMTAPGLIRRPLLTEVFTGGFGRIWMHKALRGSQLYLWSTKEGGNPYNWKEQYHGWVKTSFWGSKDKGRFSWGDGERAFYYMVETFTRPGDTVLDPFAGTCPIGAVCIALGRDYIGFEIDEERGIAAQARLRSAQRPLFIVHETDSLFDKD